MDKPWSLPLPSAVVLSRTIPSCRPRGTVLEPPGLKHHSAEWSTKLDPGLGNFLLWLKVIRHFLGWGSPEASYTWSVMLSGVQTRRGAPDCMLVPDHLELQFRASTKMLDVEPSTLQPLEC